MLVGDVQELWYENHWEQQMEEVELRDSRYVHLRG